MATSHESVLVDALPLCDFCNQDGLIQAAAVDGKTTVGPWANMCDKHFRQYGVGLGLGQGQRLVVRRDG